MPRKPRVTAAQRRFIVVGGVPAPLGGVTTFLRRMLFAETCAIEMLVDIYPGRKEKIGEGIDRKILHLGSRLAFIAWFIRNARWTKQFAMFFNFSRLGALALVIALPKPRGSHWRLMLHHGELTGGRATRLIARRVLRRMDMVYALSKRQRHVYFALGVPAHRICETKSYCPPIPLPPDPEAERVVSYLRAEFGKVLMMSGLPSPIYNFQMAIDVFASDIPSQSCLVICTYGPGPMREKLRAAAQRYRNVIVCEDKGEAFFNTLLRNADTYLRLNSRDSFGIAVADAVVMGVPAIATDVCERFPGATIVNLDEITRDPDLLTKSVQAECCVTASAAGVQTFALHTGA